MGEDYVTWLTGRLRKAQDELDKAEKSGSADPDRLAALKAIVQNRERQLASAKRAAGT